MKSALVIGAAGQDGRLLGAQLRAKGIRAIGLDRTGATCPDWPEPILSVDLLDRVAVDTFVRTHRPDQIYYLAAHHHSSEEATDTDVVELFRLSFAINVTGLVHVLDAVRGGHPAARVFYAASSHVFGRPESSTQDERTPRAPINVYGITKSAGMDAVRFYRDTLGVHASTGILYNHESIYRSEKFVTMRLALAARQAVAAKGRGEIFRMEVGSLAALVDWGYAPDYTDAMSRIVAQDAPDDYVVASGEPHTVQELAEATFAALGLDWRDHVSERPGLVKKPGHALVGDASKLRHVTGWSPTISFAELASRLARGIV